MALENERRVRILYCKDFFVAGRYAAERDWWLHAWIHLTDENAPDEVVEFVRLEEPSPLASS